MPENVRPARTAIAPAARVSLPAATAASTNSNATDEHSRVGSSSELLQLLVDNVEDYAIFLLDPQGNVASWNSGAQRIKGWTADEIIGRHFSTFYPEQDVLSGKPDWELVVAADTGRFEDEGWRLRKDGSRIWANVVITALRDRTGALRGFGKVTRDLSARREAELERLGHERKEADSLRTHSRRLAELERTKTEFLNLASHELRGPLAVVRGYVSMFEDGSLTADEFRQRLSIVVGKLAQIESLVKKMLETARLEHNSLALTIENVRLSEVVEEQLAAFEPLLDATHALKVDIAPNTPAVKGDRDRLAALVMNLLDNAAKYSPNGGSIDVMVRSSRDRVFVSVADQGVGIGPDDLEKLFTRFTRLHEAEFPSISGTGLGLFLSREIARKHGGDILVETRQGHGSRFTLSLPVDRRTGQPRHGGAV